MTLSLNELRRGDDLPTILASKDNYAVNTVPDDRSALLRP